MSVTKFYHEKFKMQVEILTGTGEILSDKKNNGEERPWVKHKKNSILIASLYKFLKDKGENILTDSRFKSLEECSDFLFFDVNERNKKRLSIANFCRLRTCPTCCWRKSLKLFSQVNNIVNTILDKAPTTRFLFVTLTVKNSEAKNLTSTIDDMNNAFKKLTNKKQKQNAFKQSLLGYMKAIEITYNQQDDTYHPHIHALFAVKSSYFAGGSYINHEDWRKIWQDCMNIDYSPIVHVQAIKKSTSSAIAEVAKYPVKVDDVLNIKDIDVAAKALSVLHRSMHDRRLVTFGGIFKTIKAELNLDDIENGDLIKADEDQSGFGNAVYGILFKYRVKVGAYIC